MPLPSQPAGFIPTGEIRWLVDRMHIGTSETSIVRDFYRRMRGNVHWTKPLRKSAYRHALQVHAENRTLYRDVCAGRIAK